MRLAPLSESIPQDLSKSIEKIQQPGVNQAMAEVEARETIINKMRQKKGRQNS